MHHTVSPSQQAKAWAVHLYTAIGLPIALICAYYLYQGNAAGFFLWACIACAIDATDGFLARKVGVKHITPHFDGAKLDDIVDYLHFVLLPMMAIPALGILPEPWWWVTILPLLASGYGFCQSVAKTDDAFVGFPSYWNILVLYLYVLDVSSGVVVASLIGLSVLVFVPIHFVYPSRTKLLMPVTLGAGVLWGGAMFAIALWPESNWSDHVAKWSLWYVVYYMVLSGVHHYQIHYQDTNRR